VSARTGPPDGEIMTLRDVARYLHCHYFTIYKLLAKGAIPALRFGRDWRFKAL
jgi:excisionase family DNA binding protein